MSFSWIHSATFVNEKAKIYSYLSTQMGMGLSAQSSPKDIILLASQTLHEFREGVNSLLKNNALESEEGVELLEKLDLLEKEISSIEHTAEALTSLQTRYDNEATKWELISLSQ